MNLSFKQIAPFERELSIKPSLKLCRSYSNIADNIPGPQPGELFRLKELESQTKKGCCFGVCMMLLGRLEYFAQSRPQADYTRLAAKCEYIEMFKRSMKHVLNAPITVMRLQAMQEAIKNALYRLPHEKRLMWSLRYNKGSHVVILDFTIDNPTLIFDSMTGLYTCSGTGERERAFTLMESQGEISETELAEALEGHCRRIIEAHVRHVKDTQNLLQTLSLEEVEYRSVVGSQALSYLNSHPLS